MYPQAAQAKFLIGEKFIYAWYVMWKPNQNLTQTINTNSGGSRSSGGGGAIFMGQKFLMTKNIFAKQSFFDPLLLDRRTFFERE